MKLIVLLALVCGVGHQVGAQVAVEKKSNEVGNRFGLALGIGSVTYLDKNSSPLIYKSVPKSVRLFYSLETTHFVFLVDIGLKLGANNPKYVKGRSLYFHEEPYDGPPADKKFPAGGTLLGGTLSLGALYKVANQSPGFTTAVGFRVADVFNYPQGWNAGGTFNALSFSPEVLVRRNISEQQMLSASFSLPAITYLARLPYDNTVSKPNEGVISGFLKSSSWVGSKKYIAPMVVLGYQYRFSNHWGAGLNYKFAWYSIEQPQLLRLLNHSISANVYRQF